MTVTPTTAPFHDKLPPASLMRAIVSPAGKDARMEPPRFSSAVEMDLPLDMDWSGVLHNFPLLTVKQAATELKCSDQHIRDFIDELKLLAFHINIAEDPKRRDYRIVRRTAGEAFTFKTHKQRMEIAEENIRTVNDWLFAPFDTGIGAWVPSLRIGARSILNAAECAKALVCNGDHIRNLYQHKLIAGVDIASQPGAGPLHLRVSRQSLAVFVTRRLARQNNINLDAPVPSPGRTQNNIQL
jgi:hypothetical protein